MPAAERRDRILALLQGIDETSVAPIRLGLDRPRAVWSALGSPIPAAQVVIVAGTNGKGSTTAFIESLLVEHGLRTGVFQSPWLFSPTECVRVNGQVFPENALWDALHRVHAVCPELTSFELFALSALSALASVSLDVAVLEVGMGGRDDVVNVIDAGVAVFTPIGIDHQRFLGADRESIGAVKAGILRKDCAAVVGDPDPPRSLMIATERVARAVFRLGNEFCVTTPSDATWSYQSGQSLLSDLPLPGLVGRFQLDNAATALKATELLGVALNPDAVRHAVQNVSLPGRLTLLSVDPAVVADVGHNPDAALQTARWVSSQCFDSVVLVLGMYADKDCDGFVKALRGCIDSLVAVPTTGSRGQCGGALLERLHGLDLPCTSAESVANGLTGAANRAGPGDLILVTGSFEVVREAYSWTAKH